MFSRISFNLLLLPLTWLCVFTWVGIFIGLGDEFLRGKMYFSLHPTRHCLNSTFLTSDDVDFITWLRWGLTGFSPCENHCFSLFTLYCWVTCDSVCVTSSGVWNFTPWRIEALYRLFDFFLMSKYFAFLLFLAIFRVPGILSFNEDMLIWLPISVLGQGVRGRKNELQKHTGDRDVLSP